MHKASVFRRSPSHINTDAYISLSHAQSLCENNKSLSNLSIYMVQLLHTRTHTFIHSRVPTLLLLNCYSLLLARFFSFLGNVIILVRLRNYCLPSSVSVSPPSLSTQHLFFFFSLLPVLLLHSHLTLLARFLFVPCYVSISQCYTITWCFFFGTR